MKKILLFIGGALLFGQGAALAQRSCGISQYKKNIAAAYPAFGERMDQQLAGQQAVADEYIARTATGAAEKTTAISAIPVVFHVIVSAARLTELGGTAGIQKRCDSQIAVLNRDYNRHNPDSTLIPSGWKPYFSNVGISFGLAHTAPTGSGTPGYEILTSSASFSSNSYGDYAAAKTAGTGLAAWDVTKYLNIWCIYFSDNPTLLGITTPPSFIGGPIPSSHMGICITYNSLGKRSLSTDSYPNGTEYDKGRTLTHECGHFFEIWHPWGDDDGLCPWESGGNDDGLSDTPPETNYQYGSPVYTIPGGTYNDSCRLHGTTNTQPIGIASLSYMDYTDDGAMHMFTTQQAAVMSSKALVSTGESYTLTQHPVLLQYPTAVTDVSLSGAFLNVYPNPTTGHVSITVNAAADDLQQIEVLNVVGQQVITVKGQKKDNYSVDLSGMSKGIYFVKCNFASGSETRKILLQ